MALLPSLSHLSLIGMDAGEWRKRKSNEERKADVNKFMKAETSGSDEWKDFEATFKKAVEAMVSRHAKVQLRIDTDRDGHNRAHVDLFHRMVRWFVADERRGFVQGSLPNQLQGSNADLLRNFRSIVSRFEAICEGDVQKMVHNFLMIGILQTVKGRGGTHAKKVADALKEMRTYIILKDREAGNQSAAPAAAPAAAARSSSASSASAPASGVTAEFQRKLDAFEDRLEQIDANIARIKSFSDDPELPALKENVLFRKMVATELELLKARQVHENAKQALANAQRAGTMGMQVISDEQRASNAVLDLELEVGDLKAEIERMQGF